MMSKNTKPAAGQCPSCGNYCNLKKELDPQDYCNDCRPSSPGSMLAEELEKFRNGAARYDASEVFKEALNSLAGGVGVYAVLDSLLRRLEFQRAVYTRQKEEIETLTKRLRKYENI
jgi:hypothetical protein